jgi:hypothetical protein
MPSIKTGRITGSSIFQPNAKVELLRIQEVSDSNLDPGTGYSERSSLWVSRISPDKFRDSGLHQATIASFHTI